MAAYGTIKEVNLQKNGSTALSLINIAGDKIYFLVLGFKKRIAGCLADNDVKNLKINWGEYIGE